MGILGMVWNIFELIYEEGEKELLDENRYIDALKELYVLVESGEITEQEYEAKEVIILEQIRKIRSYKKELLQEEDDS